MKLIVLIGLIVVLGVFAYAAAVPDTSCVEECDDIDRAWSELRIALGLTTQNSFYNPVTVEWVPESAYDTPRAVATVPSGSTLVQGPKCSAAGGQCVDVSTTSCGGLPLSSSDDCPNDLLCCPIVQTHQISMTGNKFVPDRLPIEVGDTVVWTNKDTTDHTVTFDGPVLEITSSKRSKDQTFTFTFNTAGDYQYYSDVREDQAVFMTGTITVR